MFDSELPRCTPHHGAHGGHHESTASAGRGGHGGPACQPDDAVPDAAARQGKAPILRQLIANVGAAMQRVRAAAEQFANRDRWGCLLRYISDRITPIIGPPRPPPTLAATG